MLQSAQWLINGGDDSGGRTTGSGRLALSGSRDGRNNDEAASSESNWRAKPRAEAGDTAAAAEGETLSCLLSVATSRHVLRSSGSSSDTDVDERRSSEARCGCRPAVVEEHDCDGWKPPPGTPAAAAAAAAAARNGARKNAPGGGGGGGAPLALSISISPAGDDNAARDGGKNAAVGRTSAGGLRSSGRARDRSATLLPPLDARLRRRTAAYSSAPSVPSTASRLPLRLQ